MLKSVLQFNQILDFLILFGEFHQFLSSLQYFFYPSSWLEDLKIQHDLEACQKVWFIDFEFDVKRPFESWPNSAVHS